MALVENRTFFGKTLKVSLYLLVLLISIASARPLAQTSRLDALDGLGTLATGAAAVLSLAVAVLLAITGRVSLRPVGYLWVAVYGLLIMAALGVGLFTYDNDPSEAARDFASFVCFGSAIVIGSSCAAWSGLRGPLLLACLLSVLVAVVGLLEFRQFAGDVASGARLAGRDTSLNNLTPAFGMLPLAVFTLPWWHRTGLLVIVLAWCSAISAAVLLQSRLESAFWICCGFITVIIVNRNYCTVGFRPATKRSFVLAVVVCAMGVAIAVFGGTFGAQAASLLDRFDGRIQADRSYYAGAIAVLGPENERWAILSCCWSEFGTAERIRGRGMGGSFEWLEPIVNAANEQSRRERQDALWLDDAKVFGRRQIEVGWGNPFIKGGLLLAGWTAVGMTLAIAAAIRSRTRFAVVCALVIVVNGAYALFGGDFIIGAMAKMLGEGLPIGFLLSHMSRVDPWIGALQKRI